MAIRRSVLPALAFALALTLTLILPAAAQTVEPPFRVYLPLALRMKPAKYTLTPTGDAFVFEAGPNTNTGSEPALYIGNDQDPETRLGILRSFVHFQLPDITSYEVGKATLRLYYAGYADFPDTNRPLLIQIAAGPWQENTVTWVNQPPAGHIVTVAPINSNQPFGYVELDVTNKTRGWLDDTNPNYGFMLVGLEKADDDWSYRVFASRESAYPPQLVIESYQP